LTGVADVVDTEELGSGQEGDGMEGDGAGEGVGRSDVERLVYHRLARESDKEWVVWEKSPQLGQEREDRVVLVERLGEAKARVDDDVANTPGFQLGERAGEEESQLVEELVGGAIVARGVGASGGVVGGRQRVMHQYIRRAELSYDIEHERVEGATADVVDDVGACLYGSLCRQGEAGVDGYDGIGQCAADGGDERGETVGLVVGREESRTRACGDDAEVEDVGPLVMERLGEVNSLGDRGVGAAVVEGIGGAIDDAHDGGAVEREEPVGTAERKVGEIIFEHNNKRTEVSFNYCSLKVIMTHTETEFKTITRRCRDIFEKKTRDYGTSWRILRLPSLTDQIFIKANRIRSIEMTGENRVGDDVGGEYIAIVNYAVMALIQQELSESEEMELPLEVALELYDKHLERTVRLMLDKNHDYGEAWRQMRVSSMTDLILMKLKRIKQIEDNDGKTIISEGVEGGYMDIINYSLFCLIRLEEEKEKCEK